MYFSWDHRGGRGPWGTPPRKQGEANKGPQQPNVADFIRSSAGRGGRGTGGGGGFGGYEGPMHPLRLMFLLAMLLVVIWLLSGFYVVDQSERGVVLHFGAYKETTDPGLHYHLPWPVETAYTPRVERENRISIGFRTPQSQSSYAGYLLGSSQNTGTQDVAAESLMLTGDENIVDLNFTVRWKIKDPEDFLFNVADPEHTIKSVAESAMREIIGKRPIDDALTSDRAQIELGTRTLVQKVLDSYKAGVLVTAVDLQQVNPPEQVLDAFRDVQAARADAEKAQNDAMGYANDILPRAQGQAEQIVQEAEAYKEATIAQAHGDASRFLSQYKAYVKAPLVTEKRLYINALEDVMKNAHVVVLGSGAGKNLLPYLPLGGQNQKQSQSEGGK